MKTNASQNGFTLLETMVAVSLLMLSIVGPLTIAQKSVKTSTYTKNRTTAYYLAQDAIEYLRNVRDTNSLRGYDWNRLLLAYSPCISGDPSTRCFFETLVSPDVVVSNPGTSPQAGNFIIRQCVTGYCPKLTYYTLFGYFGYFDLSTSGVVESQYRREITVTPINTGAEGNRELLIRVDVIWNEGILGGDKKISLYDEVYDWQ